MNSVAVKMNANGRVSIPAPIRHELGITPETELLSYTEDGRVVFESRTHLMERIQLIAAGQRTKSGSVTDELIADRRRASEAERAETED